MKKVLRNYQNYIDKKYFMRILILGSTGILGQTLNFFLLNNKKNKIFYISRKKSLTNKSHLYLEDFKNFTKLKKLILTINPTHIVNCLGVTKYNDTYKLNEETKVINTKLPKFLSILCLKNKIYMIHISTDCVFSGKKGNYSELSKKDAKDLYAITKNKGEIKNKFVTTIRTSFIGPEKKTYKSLLSWFLKQKKEVNGYNKAFFSGLTSLELAKIIYKFFLTKKIFYNMIINVGGNKISKYLLLKKIAKIFNKKIIIKKFSTFKINRSLNNNKFIRKSNYKILSWDIMLKDLKLFMITNKYKY
tara:strand:+ start:613 stop:1521 length:909 start_codon:yes stop_codon:yes gene_type:complete